MALLRAGQAETLVLRFHNVLPGTYGIALLHDENGNGRADRALSMLRAAGIDDARVSYDTVQTRDTLNALINATGLNKYRGQIAPRNAFNSKWFTKIDLHLAQEIPTGLGASRIQVFLDVENFANLLNKKWGQLRQYSFPYTIAAVRAQCLTAPVATGTAAGSAVATNTSQGCAQYRYLAPNSTPTDTISSQESLYQIRIGARFSF